MNKKTSITAEQIEHGELEQLGKWVAAHLRKMRAYEAKAQKKAGVELRKANDNWKSATHYLAQAKEQCDDGGFEAFQKKYCPDLSRSWIYELLAIGTGKKTVEEARSETLKRVQKHRAKASVTPPVTDEPEPVPAPAPDEPEPIEPEQVPAPIEPEPIEPEPIEPEPPAKEPASQKPAKSALPITEAPPTKQAQDVGPYSRSETDRLRSRVDELGAEKRMLEIKITGLEDENRELKARIAALENTGDLQKAI